MHCCRPLLHALLEPGVAACTGVELDRIKVDKSAAFFKRAAAELDSRGICLKLTPTMHCSPIEKVDLPLSTRRAAAAELWSCELQTSSAQRPNCAVAASASL